MVTTDHVAIADRIIEMINANETLINNEDINKKLRKVFFTEPDYEIEDENTPYCYIAIPNRYQFTQEEMTESTEFNQAVIELTATVIVQRKDAETTQRSLYGIADEILKTIRANPTLFKPGTTTDPKAVRSNILNIGRPPNIPRGSELAGSILLIQLQIGTQFSLTVPGLADMPLLEKPIEREVEEFENVYNTGLIRKRTAPITETHSFFARIEYTDARMAQLRTLKRARNAISFTLKRGIVAETRNGRLENMDNGAPFDKRETIIVQIEVFN